MIVDFTQQQKADILRQVIGKSFVWNDAYLYDHGRTVSTELTGVDIDQENDYVKLRHRITFEDGTAHDYTTDGSWFFDHYRHDIEKHLGVELYWQVRRSGAYPIMLNPQDVKKCDTWLICHEYKGMIIFENYSRAMLCWHEKNENNSWGIVKN